jgi:hypothetical protein
LWQACLCIEENRLNNLFGLYNLKERDNAPKGKENITKVYLFFSDL